MASLFGDTDKRTARDTGKMAAGGGGGSRCWAGLWQQVLSEDEPGNTLWRSSRFHLRTLMP